MALKVELLTNALVNVALVNDALVNESRSGRRSTGCDSKATTLFPQKLHNRGQLVVGREFLSSNIKE